MQAHHRRLALAAIASQMIFACAASGPARDTGGLNDTGWILFALPGESLSGDQPVTMHFENGRVHGSDGCNRYSTTFTAMGDQVRLAENIASTRMACPESLMRQAEAFTGALMKARKFRIDARQLVLLDAGGSELAILSAQRRDLAATSWRVSGYNNGKQAVVSVLPDSQLTISFAGDGRLTGSAGCNSYTASYSTAGNSIRIGQAAATRKMCSKPDGLKEQEKRFLRALASAASWQLDGGRLELRTATGALALSLTAAEPAAGPTPGQSGTVSLACGDQQVLVAYQEEKLQLNLGSETFSMRQVAAASGARYVAEGDATTTFWSKGERATLIVRGKAYPECTQAPAAFLQGGE